MAATLKRMCRTFLLAQDIPPSRIDHYLYDAKHIIIPELGTSARHLLQTLGTEWGRGCVHPNVWVRTWERQVSLKLREGYSVICDDIRRSNEAEAVLRLGGELWKIVRTSATRTTDHASEGELDTFPNFTLTIPNNGSLSALYASLPRPSSYPPAP
jgi:hypothetical protein